MWFYLNLDHSLLDFLQGHEGLSGAVQFDHGDFHEEFSLEALDLLFLVFQLKLQPGRREIRAAGEG